MKVHPYFENSVRMRRPEVTVELCRRVLTSPLRTEVQPDGRIRHWGYVAEQDKYLRVVTLSDGETLFNAFFDRSFQP